MSRWKLPEGWGWAKAGEIADVVGGGTPKSKDPTNFEEPGIPWLTPADLSGYKGRTISRGARGLSQKGLSSCGAKMMPPGSVLFSSRAPIGYCVVADNEISTNQGFKSLVLKGSIEPQFIRNYLLASKEYAESLASGTTFKELSGAKMKGLEVPLAPLNEQRRIVAKIEALQARSQSARTALGAIPPLLEKFRQSVLAAAFRGDLTADWRAQNPDVEPASELLERIRTERRARWEAAELAKMKAKGKELKNDKWKESYKEPAKLDMEGLPSLPTGWAWTTLEDLCGLESNSLTDGPFGSKLKTKDYVASGVRVIRLGNIGVGRFKATNEAYISAEKYNGLRKHEIFSGDLVIAALAEPVGRATIIPESVGPAVVKADCIRFNPSEAVSSEFVMHVLNSPGGRRRAEELSHGIGRLRINMADIRRLPVPIAPLAEQQELLSVLRGHLSRIESLESLFASSENSLVDLNSAVLAKAFRGELVPQIAGERQEAVA